MKTILGAVFGLVVALILVATIEYAWVTCPGIVIFGAAFIAYRAVRASRK